MPTRTSRCALVERRLLVADSGAVELVHEALLERWPRLAEWLDEDAQGRRLHRHLTQAAVEWRVREEPSEALSRAASRRRSSGPIPPATTPGSAGSSASSWRRAGPPSPARTGACASCSRSRSSSSSRRSSQVRSRSPHAARRGSRRPRRSRSSSGRRRWSSRASTALLLAREGVEPRRFGCNPEQSARRAPAQPGGAGGARAGGARVLDDALQPRRPRVGSPRR